MKGMAGICFILIGIISIVFGAFFLFSNSNSSTSRGDFASGESEIYQETSNPNREKKDYTLFQEKLAEPNNTPVRAVEMEQRAAMPTANKATAYATDSQRKGYEFEKFIVKKFVKEYFKLLEWTSDKYTDGIYAENAKQPDLVYEFALDDSTYSFAVECKWRKTFYNNEVEIANTQQIRNYKAFEQKRGVPVFVTLGIGGEPSSPKQLFIIPLNKIFSNKVDQSFLKEFEQVPTRNFFYDHSSKSLSVRLKQSAEEQI